MRQPIFLFLCLFVPALMGLWACDDLTWRASECEADQTGCDGTWKTQCRNGKWADVTDCADLDKICVGGACVHPEDGDAESDGDATDEAELDETGDGDGDGESEEDQEWEMTDPGLTWVSIPGGTYQMGCVPQDTQCEDYEKPRHSVTVSAFEMTSTEITQGQYFAVMGRNPSYYSSCGEDCPVEQVDWNEAAAFCEAVGGRLPTEEEWEYAARAETTTIYPCGDDARCLTEIAWYDDNSEDSTHSVAQKTANGFGLYDMIGNVWEWTSSCWRSDYNSSQDCSQRVIRGGSWDYYARNDRSSYRYRDVPALRLSSMGLRCGRD